MAVIAAMKHLQAGHKLLMLAYISAVSCEANDMLSKLASRMAL